MTYDKILVYAVKKGNKFGFPLYCKDRNTTMSFDNVEEAERFIRDRIKAGNENEVEYTITGKIGLRTFDDIKTIKR